MAVRCSVCGGEADGNFSTYGNPRVLDWLDGRCLSWANYEMEAPLLRQHFRLVEDQYWAMVGASVMKTLVVALLLALGVPALLAEDPPPPPIGPQMDPNGSGSGSIDPNG